MSEGMQKAFRNGKCEFSTIQRTANFQVKELLEDFDTTPFDKHY